MALTPREVDALVARGPAVDVLVGVPAGADAAAAAQRAEEHAAELRRAMPGLAGVAVALDPTRGVVHAAGAAGAPPIGGGEGGALAALVRAGDRLGARAVALVQPVDADAGDRVARLVAPVLDGGFDVSCPAYARRKLDGGLHAGLTAPVSRGLLGVRLRQPVARELALSRRAAQHLLADGAWLAESADGPDLWLASPALLSGLRACEAAVGAPPPGAPAVDDVAGALVHAAGLLFRGVERHATAWQRNRAVAEVERWGALPPVEGAAPPPDPAPLAAAFRLAHRELGRLWRAVLPPGTLLALDRAAARPDAELRVDDALWARVVYDFLVGWHLRALERAQLLRAMAPLYLGWFAGFAQDAARAGAAELEERRDSVAEEFRRARRYLVARWRWPDRFAP